jgi:hypothetical protein
MQALDSPSGSEQEEEEGVNMGEDSDHLTTPFDVDVDMDVTDEAIADVEPPLEFSTRESGESARDMRVHANRGNKR